MAAPGALLVSGGRVVAAGPPDDVAPLVPPGTSRHDHPGAVILPGLVNAHAHLQMAPLAPAAPGGTPFVEWLLSVVAWRRTAEPASFARNLVEATAELIASGTTTVGEICGPDEEAYARVPFRARVFAEGIGFLPSSAEKAEKGVRESLDRIASAALRNRRVMPGISPHAPYTVSGELLSRLNAMSLLLGLPVTIHLAESDAERRFLADGGGPVAERLYQALGLDVSWFRGTGVSIPAWLRRAGLLRPGLSVVHNTRLSPDEAGEIAAAGASFVLCPRSNRLLGNGSPDVTLFLDRGYATALGTDGRASVPTLSLWDEMREALSLYGGEKGTDGAARLLLLAATEGGAKALELPCGALSGGLPADFLVADDPGGEGDAFFRRLLERTGAGEVRAVFVDGVEVSFVGNSTGAASTHKVSGPVMTSEGE